jgi:UDP-N-acetylglucosamine 1-carboxyvinyltransferase
MLQHPGENQDIAMHSSVQNGQRALRIQGGTPLEGRLIAAGAKNAMTKLLVASLLSDQESVFENVPNIGDVETTVDLVQELGAHVEWDRDQKILRIRTPELKTTYIPQRFSGANRIPILLIGALLGRTDQDIIVPTVGGDAIGSRPVDFHIAALEHLGARVEFRSMKREGAYLARAHQGLRGAVIQLPFPSVGATENSILAAVRAKGSTIIHNAAIEPEIIDLILYLQKAGVRIGFEGDRSIRIHECTHFKPVRHRVIPDRAEAASFAVAAIATQGRVFIEGLQHAPLLSFLEALQKVGAGFEIRHDGIEFWYAGPLQGGLHLETGVYPGFLTDQQQPFVVMLTQAHGASVIHETIYENRFGYVETLKRMGAKIDLFTSCLGTSCRYHQQSFNHSAVVMGPTPLTGADIQIPDLRAGFAYVMAALLAPDESLVRGLHFLERGYEYLVPRLQSLGACLEIVDEPLPSCTPRELVQTLRSPLSAPSPVIQ